MRYIVAEVCGVPGMYNELSTNTYTRRVPRRDRVSPGESLSGRGAQSLHDSVANPLASY